MTLGRALRGPAPGAADVVAFGENSLDTIVVAASAIPGAKHHASRLLEAPGGQAATAAVACARLGWRTRYAGVVGADAAGRDVTETLVREGVEPVVVVRADAPTRRAVVLVDAGTGDRTIFEHRDAALDVRPGEIDDAVFTAARILIVDACDPSACQAARTAQAAGVRTIVDADRAGRDVEALLGHIDLIVLPAETALALGVRPTLGEAIARLGAETRAAAVVVTLGSEGALAWCPAGEIRVPAADLPVVDTTGAGDAFRAGLAAAWLGSAGRDPVLEHLLADATLVAGLSCRALGAQAGLPGWQEVPERLRGRV